MVGKYKILFFGFVFLFVLVLVFGGFVRAGVSDSGVRYDTELIGQFALNKWVLVMVDIKDTSNIVIPNRNDPDFESIVKQRNEILIKQTNTVLSSLSEDEFHLDVNSEFGGFFSGEITKQGFNKLLKDERVEYVYAEHELDLHAGGMILRGGIVRQIVIPLILVVVILTGAFLLIKMKKKKWKRKR